MLTLRRTLEELSHEEHEALLEAIATDEYWKSFDDERQAALVIRTRLAATPTQQVPPEDLVAVLNYLENIRIVMHVTLVLGSRSIMRVSESLRSAACSYCDWTYRDEMFEWPTDREITDADIQGVNDRIRDAIREHVTICQNHPMRALEAKLAEVAV